jgi:hypothetical protein
MQTTVIFSNTISSTFKQKSFTIYISVKCEMIVWYEKYDSCQMVKFCKIIVRRVWIVSVKYTYRNSDEYLYFQNSLGELIDGMFYHS